MANLISGKQMYILSNKNGFWIKFIFAKANDPAWKFNASTITALLLSFFNEMKVFEVISMKKWVYFVGVVDKLWAECIEICAAMRFKKWFGFISFGLNSNRFGPFHVAFVGINVLIISIRWLETCKPSFCAWCKEKV